MRFVFGRLGPVALLVGFPALVSGQSNPAGKDAKAILEAKCFACHGDVRMSDLDLRDRRTILKGGKRGPAVVPGNAEASLLYRAIRREGELQMPPGKTPLTPSEVGILREWIDAGARVEPESGAAGARASWWSFRKPVRPPVPIVKSASWVRNPIDAFILAKLEPTGLRPASRAGRQTLVRRAYFDLHGLPPTPEQVEQFVNDPSSDAYEKLIDRLLESPRYGERWGRYWLDLVRYADTSGFETDHFFVTAWRYRDYVIGCFNMDKPYTTFVQEQIAADELWSTNMDLEGTLKLPKEKRENVNRRVGTALFTLGSFPIEFTYYGDQYRAEWQADAVDTVGAAFLGLTVACARCHDHKFDPISQREYYQLTSLFAGSVEREIPLVSLFDVQTNTRNFPLLAQAETLKRMARGGRSRRGHSGTEDPQRAALLQRLAEAYLRAPERYPTANVLAHEEIVPDTHILIRGDFKNQGEKVEPGFLTALNPGPPIQEPEGFLFVPQRRKALALWLTSPDQPLLGRVMVNRIWQGHFGQGMVNTPNDFGRQGEAPTHPELLDWLAVEFADRGWSIKQMHRLIMLSNTYQSSSVADDESLRKDPENRYLSRMNRRRLDGDAIRDSVLAVAGTLNLKMGGVGIIPPLSKEEILAARMPQLWPANPDPAEHTRRSIYLQMKRSMTLPMLQIFDAPDTATSCARRESSTVAPQALALMNSEFALAQAEQFASRIRKQAGEDPEASVNTGWRLAFGRLPAAEERRTALDYLQRNSLPRLCLLIFNMSEFVYVD
ncbi:MAG: PSD1 and planctomycete cytochrome C domain-containing protein [Bryobacteraceae bacterium]